MKTGIKTLDDSIYSSVCEWWVARGWPVIPKDVLPKRGYVVFSDKPVIAGFLYKDETACLGWLDWIVSNPETTTEERNEGLRELLNHIEIVSREIGIKCLMTITQNQKFSEKLVSNGYLNTGADWIQLTKGV